jgi:3'(2'), 5'-bisphosphate nucleotidase
MFEEELTTAVALARGGGDIINQIYGRDVEVQYKSPSDPVTEADRSVNRYLVSELSRAFPNDAIIAEESALDASAANAARCWYVDPLDGTKEFIARNGEFSVMIGLAVDGRACLGVVYRPDGDKLYRGVVGQGAVLEHAGKETALHVSDVSDTSALRLVVSRSHRPPTTEALMRSLGATSERPSGSVGLKVGLIAEQQADLYVHHSGRASRWDSCGPEAILRAAGGRFTDLFGDDIIYDGREVKNRRGLLACNAAAYDAVLPFVRAAAEQGID